MNKGVVSQIQADFTKAVHTLEILKKLKSLGAEANGSTTADTAMPADHERYGTIVRRINLVLE